MSSLRPSHAPRVTLVRRAQKRSLREGLKPIERQSSLIPADRPLSLCYCFVNVAMLLRPRRVIRITATIQSLALPSPRLRHRADLFRIVNEKLISLRAQGRCGFLTLPAAQAAEAERSAKANVHTRSHRVLQCRSRPYCVERPVRVQAVSRSMLSCRSGSVREAVSCLKCSVT